jgi:hypothetical protein
MCWQEFDGVFYKSEAGGQERRGVEGGSQEVSFPFVLTETEVWFTLCLFLFLMLPNTFSW